MINIQVKVVKKDGGVPQLKREMTADSFSFNYNVLADGIGLLVYRPDAEGSPSWHQTFEPDENCVIVMGGV